MANGSERRQFGRVHLLAHGRDRTCTIVYGDTVGQAMLIDISAGGARIRCTPPPPGLDVTQLVLHVAVVNDAGRLQNLAGSVRWRDGTELGVQFVNELDLGVRALQDLVG